MTIPLFPAPQENYGEVFTRRWVVAFILDLCEYTQDRDLSRLRVVDPSVGSGAFVRVLVERLLASHQAYGTQFNELGPCIRGWDLQPQHVETCRRLSLKQLLDAGCPKSTADALVDEWFRVGDFLLDPEPFVADVVVGNPPYIRLEDLPRDLLDRYRAACPAMTGRADIYVGFIERSLKALKPGGVVGYVCADRWMHNDYGRGLRAMLTSGEFAMDVAAAMHDVDAFERDVSAYPAVTVMRRGPQRSAVVVDAHAGFNHVQASRVVDFAANRRKRFSSANSTGFRMKDWHNTAASWPVGTPEVIDWLERLEETLPKIEDSAPGTKIGIGIATGSDRVYVRREHELPDVEGDRLLPLAHAQDLRSGTFTWTGHHLVSPWEASGLVDLAEYPKLAAYYEGNKAAICGRNVAKKSPKNWFRTIDRVNLGLLSDDYLALGDMRKHIEPVRVKAGYYPHHNLYFVGSGQWDLDVLGGILLSDAVESQVAAYCVKMRGGTLRFQAQYLRRIRIPSVDQISAPVAADFAAAFRDRDRDRASRTAAAWFASLGVPMP